jgi:Ribonucleotide reductase inhibitor
MVSMSKRRRFQAPITSFFTTQSISAPESVPNGAQPSQQYETLPSPTLPHAIQSSLLTVGMRIRKSVPEGYKTHKTLPSASLHEHRGYFLDAGNQDSDFAIHGASSSAHGGYAELAPFCGLHKIGGMAVQPMPAASISNYRHISAPKRAEQAEESDPWSLPSSQESTDSNAPRAPSNKRTFAPDQENNGDDDGFGNALQSQQRSPYPFSHTRMPDLNTLLPSPGAQSLRATNAGTQRAYAIPCSRFAGRKGRNPALEGQENLGLTLKACGGPANTTTTTALVNEAEVDFEDADFLQERGDVDVDDEYLMDAS